MEKEEWVDEATNSSEEEESQEDSTQEEQGQEPDLSQELERERQARQQLTARAKRAEEEAKALREKYESLNEKKAETEAKAQPASPDVDERVLKAQGMPDDLLKELKAISQVRGVPLIDAQSDPLFAAVKAEYERNQKASEASLGASKGSGQPKPKVDFTTPGLSREDHRKLFKEKFR